ncbi:NAD(P)/FAD-dependent oxidoreductase [Sneathiella glossodoripedis]|uniref:NAD(P)/FAD-dependent oxidoreductase n=1 Tax=Sneathiella glossodoripedis TaxID=418853 RepID=UPI00046F71E3|nr:NAD(P)/FAD-dependent oxidoreductase [Sneathiella glossodoripedis]
MRKSGVVDFNKKYDVAIIGAGPAGTVAAKMLRDEGYSVAIVEGAQFPRFSIGESLLPNCLNVLEKAGMLQAVEDAGFQFKDGAVFERSDEKRSIDFRKNFDDGWGTAYQVQRALFDQLLADCASDAGADIRYKCFVKGAVLSKGYCELHCELPDGSVQTLTSSFVLDASGYGRVLSRLLSLETPSSLPARSVVFTHVEDHISDPQFDRDKILITVHPERKDVWYWLIPFSNGTSSVGVVYLETDRERKAESDKQILHTLINQTALGELLNEAVPIRDIGKMSGYSCNVSKLHGPGFALLGNAAEFLDPVFSSGVTIALHSANLAVPAVVKELRGEEPDWQSIFADPLKGGVDVFRVFVEAWYEGTLQDIILRHPEGDLDLSKMMVSILSGYAWSMSNPLVQKPKRYLRLLKALCE